MATLPTFWMVLGAGAPTVRHPSEQQARAEAERLARQQPGQEFVVLQAIGAASFQAVRWERMDDLPY